MHRSGNLVSKYVPIYIVSFEIDGPEVLHELSMDFQLIFVKADELKQIVTRETTRLAGAGPIS